MPFTLRTLRARAASFKFRLVAYFLLLSLLPLFGALWAFGEVAVRSETGRADARLPAALRVAVADFDDRMREANATATSLARATEAATRTNDAALARLYREVPSAGFYANGQRIAGSARPPLGVDVSARVLDKRGRVIGSVVVSVALDDQLVAELRRRSAFERDDELALLARGSVVVGPAQLANSTLPFGRPADLELRDGRFRAIAEPLPNARATLVALAPTSKIEAQANALRRRILVLGLIAIAIASALAYALGRTIVRSLKDLVDAAGAVASGNFSSRVPVRGHDEFSTLGRAFNDMAAQLEARLDELASERARGRDAIERFGEALSATNNPYVLLPVIVESVVEATGAAGGRLIIDGDEVARAGEPESGREPLVVPLTDEYDGAAVLLLTPSHSEFSKESRDLAHWLASQAWTALENARLHVRLEREAVTDGLTDLPNRRQFEDSLEGELTRVKRFGGSLGLIIADLDDFKQVNDRYGHLAGDDVLRAFADVLRNTVREIDMPARYGGEEFAVLLPQTDLDGTERVAERIRSAMDGLVVETSPGALVTVTASFGVAAFPASPTPEALFVDADEALYRAKAGGKNQVAVAGMAEAVRRDA